MHIDLNHFGFLDEVAPTTRKSKNHKNNQMSSNMGSVPDPEIAVP